MCRVMLPMFGLVYSQGTDSAGTRVYILVTPPITSRVWEIFGIHDNLCFLHCCYLVMVLMQSSPQCLDDRLCIENQNDTNTFSPSAGQTAVVMASWKM